ncbi:MAG: hypothetical protein OXE44_15720 [Nitrospinae bacterium]|nr:hypothetical protein [Nitrospinota bacterium]
MKKAILLFTLIVFLLMGGAARAEECYLELRGGIGAWKGPCKDGKAYGTGVATFPNGTYAGSAQDGRAHGRGKWRLEDGLYLEGEFRHGDVHGRHVGKDSEGIRITGELQMGDDGKRHLIFLRDDRQADDDIPAQDVASSRLENADKASEANAASGDAATPGAKNEVESARRAESAPDPSDSPVVEASPPAGALARTPVREEPDAHNCRLEADGEFFDWSGPCRDGRAHGNGQATAPDGMAYTGSAKDGKPHGHGTVTSASGQMLYQGGYRDGVPHGRGTFLDEDGRYYVSDFEGGQEVGERMPAQGFASDESGPENAGDTDVLAEEAALPGVDEDGNQKGDDGYEAAVDALDGGDGVVRPAMPDDDYDAKLTELERREALEIEAWAREKELKAERRSEALKAELRKKAAAKDLEKKRGRAALEAKSKEYWERELGSSKTRRSRRRTSSDNFGGFGRSLNELHKKIQEIDRSNKQFKRKLQTYKKKRKARERQRELERQRRIEQQRRKQLEWQRTVERRRQEQLAHQRRVEQQRSEQIERQRREQKERERRERLARLARERDRKIASLRNALNRALARCNRLKRGRSGCRNHNRRFYNGEIRNAIRNYEILSK